MNKNNKKSVTVSSSNGFTLIELLVVISIISVLSGVVLQSINSTRAKSRDAQRLTEIDQINKALELFATGGTNALPSTGINTYVCLGLTSNTPPSCGNGLPGSPTIIYSGNSVADTAIKNNLANKVIPRDPKFQNDFGTAYLYNSNAAPVTTPASTAGAYLSWVMEGSTTCGRGVKATTNIGSNGTTCFLRVGNAI